MAKTKIGWTDYVWGPVTGCTKVSDGCTHCYAEVIAEKYRGTPAFPEGLRHHAPTRTSSGSQTSGRSHRSSSLTRCPTSSTGDIP